MSSNSVPEICSHCHQMDLLSYMKNKDHDFGGQELYEVLDEIVLLGLYDIAKYMLEKSFIDKEDFLSTACSNGKIELVQHIVDQCELQWLNDEISCLDKSELEIANILIKHGANAYLFSGQNALLHYNKAMDLENKYKELEKNYNSLKEKYDELYYAPDGPGAKEAKNDFEHLSINQ